MRNMLLSLRRKKNPYKDLEKRIGYGFKKRELVETALMHRSYRFENTGITSDNQRMEFLGDAVLGFAAAAHLYENHDDCDEGDLTSYRSQTTNGQILADIAESIDLGVHIKMGKGEENSGGRKRPSNLADALEAVIGAAYLDGGLKAVNRIFEELFVPRLERLSGDVWDGNPKGRLQEFSQRTWKASPRYRIVSKDGPPHAAIFTVEVTLADGSMGTGKGRNKQEAEAQAAGEALSRLDGQKSGT